MPRPGRDDARRALRLLTLGLAVASAVTLAPLWAPLVMAAWVAALLQPPVRRLQRALRGRRRGAAAIVVLLVVAVLGPLAGVVAAVVVGARELLLEMRAALEGQGTVAGVLLGSGEGAPLTLPQWADLATRYGANAWRALSALVRTSTTVLLAALVFVVALYALAATGSQSYRWLARHAPLPARALARLARAFHETGRGLLVGGGGTALVQGLAATVAYAAMGIPRAALLGPLTAVCALVPVVGTGLVWGPLAVGLAAAGDWARAGLVLAVGAGVLSLIDNFVRPWLTRRGSLRLPTVVVLVAMLGGIAAFGASGALLGPLLVRLTVEALAFAREGRAPDAG